MIARGWLAIAIACACACGKSSPPPPPYVPLPRPIDAGAGSGFSKAAASNDALERLKRDREQFDRAVADPANRAAGWVEVETGAGSDVELTRLAIDGTAVVASSDAVAVRSTDGGATWKRVPGTGSGSGSGSWVGLDGTKYRAVFGRTAGSLESSHDGTTWTRELPFPPRDMAFARGATYVVGYRGTVWTIKSTR